MQTDQADTARARADFAQDAAGVFEAFTTAEAESLRDVLTLAVRVAATGPPSLPAVPRNVGRLPDVAVVTAGPAEMRVVAGSLPGLPADIGSVPALATALALSRDSADIGVVLSAPVDGPPPRPYAAAPLFRRADGNLRATPPQSTTERRASIAGWVVARVDPTSGLAAALPSGLRGRVLDGDLPLAGSASAPSSDEVISRAVTVGNRRWTIDVWPASNSGGGAMGWWLVAGALGAIAVLVSDAYHRRGRRRAEETADTALAHVDLVADLAPVVQRSLELGEVLPAVATALASELGLAGIVFAEAAADNEFRDVFSVGEVDASTAWQTTASSLPAGESLSLALQRGSRAVGLLRIKAGRPLDTDDLRCVRIAAELATAAIVTGQLFSQQEEAVVRLQELDALKSIFLATASHELRTPLVAITGFSAILRDQWERLSEDDRRLFITRIATNAQSLSSLIEGLLDFSRLERGALEVRLDRMDLSTKVAAVLDQLGPTFGTHTLQAELTPGAMVMADPFGIERIVSNLVSNAVKYSPAGSKVEVRVDERNGRTRLIVSDEGPGVPEEQREQIFSRFFRGDDVAVVRTRGVGIGLSVVKEFVDQMQATIEVSSSPSGGAEFVLWFPPVADPDAASVSEEESRAPLS